jgi:hypothetical protein
MKNYLPKTERLPLGMRQGVGLGLSGILENKVTQYMTEFPKRCRVKPASVNKGALTFKLIPTSRRKRK